MDQLNFIFTKTSFHIDEAKDSAWAELFKNNYRLTNRRNPKENRNCLINILKL